MEKRVQINDADPKAYTAIFGLENYLNNSKLSKTHIELIKLRASLINGCTFCIDMHTKEALKNGAELQRLYLLNAWKKADVYTEEERVILQMTDEITMIHQKGLTPETYQKAMSLFDEQYFSLIVMAISTINVWNRVAISTHTPIGG